MGWGLFTGDEVGTYYFGAIAAGVGLELLGAAAVAGGARVWSGVRASPATSSGVHLQDEVAALARMREANTSARGRELNARISARGGSVTRPVGFVDEARLLSHFKRHGGEFGVSTAEDYLQVGLDIVKNGTKVKYTYKGETTTGYVQFMSNSRNGAAKFGFVGTNSSGTITTIHVRSGESVWKMLNGNASRRFIRPVP
jgi:hypothetical protein